MVKDKKRKEEKPKKSDFKAFLKKRAPIYLAILALFVVFVIPELTKGDLQSNFPELSEEQKLPVEILMNYNGPNESGLTVLDAISNKIVEEYPNEKIFDDKKTTVNLIVSKIDSEKYQVLLDFKSHKGEMNFDWTVDINSKKITSNNLESKYIIDLVDFYD
ncbi:MAG: hypothetical protein K5790_08915 [Nitrosopumilus sp.]|uniref:hypothetical protein n=1 Tax=Nitrosopumilus sp. TaxID=2024843 RepID=UPI00247CAA7C|nr:hypothetical protein [Nitrosopumilus sp.]MCV0393389.1 hypothetical protein [Nitrosopumilus sp.]